MELQPIWVTEATDMALVHATVAAANLLDSYDLCRIADEALQHFELHGYGYSDDLYYWFRSRSDAPRIYHASRGLCVLNTISCSPQSSEVWRAFERFGTPPPDFVISMCIAAGHAIDRFEKVAITTKDIKSAGSRIRTLALKLAAELSNPAVQQALDQVRKQGREAGKRTRGYVASESCAELASLATGLSTIPRIIGQPNSPGARRLYFIREMTDWLYLRMGTPMRSQVYALTSVFFNVDDITPQKLATLAPVSKSKENEPVSGTVKTSEISA